MNTRPLHSYPRYFQDWLLSETRSRLNLQERGLFGDLCDLIATDGGSILDDEATIQKRAACTSREWKSAWPKVRECFEAKEGRLYNSKLTYALENAARSFDARSAGGKAASQARWGKSGNDSSATSSVIAAEIAELLPSVPPPFPLRSLPEEHPLPPQGGLFTNEPVGPDPYEKARDAIWEFWDPAKRYLSKADMLRLLKKTIKANGHTEQVLEDYVKAAKTYSEAAGEYAIRFDRYAKQAVDGPVAAPVQKQLPNQRVEPVRQIYREEPRRGPAPPCMDFNTILADRLGRK